MSQHKPFFSIVIPVHNGEDFIEDTLRSILQQSYQNFDITLLENQSTDRTTELAQALGDLRIKIIPAVRYLSMEDNWGRILDLDLPEFLCIFCHDDPMYPGYLEEIAQLIQAEPDATLYHTAFDFIGSKLHAKPAEYKETGDEYLFRFHSFKEDSAGSGYVMRFTDYRRVNGFPNVPKLLFADITCWYRISKLSYKVCSPKIGYGYRIHQNSVGAQAALLDFAEAFRQYFDALNESGHLEDENFRWQAMKFAAIFYEWRHCNYLASLINSDQANCLTGYPQLKEQIRAYLSIYASYIYLNRRMIRVHELIASIQNPRLRRLVFQNLRVAVAINTRRKRAVKQISRLFGANTD